MYYVCIGFIAGVFLVFLAVRAGHGRSSWPAWLAAEIEVILLIPIVLEFFKTEFFEGRGLIVALRIVLFPWLAGIGFAIWIYLTTIPLQLLFRMIRRRLRRRINREALALRQRLAREMHYKIANSWRHIRDIEFDGRSPIRAMKERTDYIAKIINAHRRADSNAESPGT
jgi:hypothetical protein